MVIKMNDSSPIFRSLAISEEKIQERLTVEALAASINFSKYHYQHIFHEAVGDTVMGYVTRRKLYLAAEELAGTTDSVLEVALRYGYDSHEGFTRSFKAHTGVTPTEYRKCLSSKAATRRGSALEREKLREYLEIVLDMEKNILLRERLIEVLSAKRDRLGICKPLSMPSKPQAQ